MKIVVGCQVETPHGRAAIDEAVRQCGADDTLVLVGFVARPARENVRESLSKETARIREQCEAKEVEITQERGIEVVIEIPVGASSPSDALLRAAGLHDVDLTVIGLRQRTKVGKLLLGSNAQDILLHSKSNVLAVTLPE